MRPAVAVDERCTACAMCVVTCPERALLPAPKRPLVLAQRCTGCLQCVESCPADAVTPMPGHPVRAGR